MPHRCLHMPVEALAKVSCVTLQPIYHLLKADDAVVHLL